MLRYLDVVRRLSFNRLDGAAMAYAVLLSFACLAKGAVYDAMLAVLLMLALPVLALAMSQFRPVHEGLRRVGGAFLLGFSLVLLLQWLMPVNTTDHFWQQVTALTGHSADDVALQDKAAWIQGFGRFLFFIVTFSVALRIGASESSARLFFNALLVSGVVCVAITFFATTSEGVPATTFYSYHHGLVNPNNAAAYLGILLLLTLMQAVRYLRHPAHATRVSLMVMLDRLTIGTIVRGGFLLFALLLSIAGLFLTASRAGIMLSLLSCMVFLLMVAFKTRLKSRRGTLLILGTSLLLVTVIAWSFFNFGAVVSDKVRADGVSLNSRTDIIAAVLPMVADHPLLGSGLGSFPGVFQRYRPTNVSSDGIIDKAHNSYVEFAAEMGLPALVMLLAALGWMGWQMYRGFFERKERYLVSALGFTVWMFMALYSLIDFPLQIPGIAALALAIATVSVSQTDRRFSEPATKHSNARSQRVRIRKRRTSNAKAI